MLAISYFELIILLRVRTPIAELGIADEWTEWAHELWSFQAFISLLRCSLSFLFFNR